MERNQYNKEYRQKRLDQGLCVSCGLPNKGNFNRCQECLDEIKIKRKDNNAKGLCGCGKTNKQGYKVCEACLYRTSNRYIKNKELISLQRKEKRNKNKKKGLYVFCDAVSLPTKTTCAYHLQKRADFRQYCKEQGICPQCGDLKSDTKNNYCDKHQQYWKARKRAEGLRIKKEVISHYNKLSKCSCCGEPNLVFLTIDHINNNGNEHRKKINRFGEGFYRWLINNNFPSGYQVLCFNCNCGRRVNGGICPHKTY